MAMYLAINQCPRHKKFLAIMLEDEDEHGTRLTPSKCCGSWVLVQRWPVTADTLRDALEKFECAEEGE